jgi:hypothetical protein
MPLALSLRNGAEVLGIEWLLVCNSDCFVEGYSIYSLMMNLMTLPVAQAV